MHVNGFCIWFNQFCGNYSATFNAVIIVHQKKLRRVLCALLCDLSETKKETFCIYLMNLFIHFSFPSEYGGYFKLGSKRNGFCKMLL